MIMSPHNPTRAASPKTAAGKKVPMLIKQALTSLATFVFAAAVSPAAADATPNVLLVIADDMGLDASPCYSVGDNAAPMPNLEQLCAEGMVFENAYAAPSCSPTRAMLMTGRYGFATGVGSAITPDNRVGLSADETSLFDLLNETDYASAIIGKWHLAGPKDGLTHPADLGVKNYFGLYTGGTRDYSRFEAVENGEKQTVSGYATTVFTDRAIDWIGDQTSPWFLWLAYNAPHAPFHAPPADLHTYGDLPTDKRSIKRDQRTYYNAMLQALDTEMGRLLASIPRDVRDNTVVMFIGDNGTPGQIAGQFYGSRGAKGGIFEGGTHVPLVVSGPGVEAGRSDALVNVVDLHVTIAGLAGTKPTGKHGNNFSHVLSGGEGDRRHIYVEHFSQSAPRGSGTLGWALRDDRYKLVAVEGQEQMLFDLEKDPFERRDLLADGGSADLKARVAELQTVVDELRND